RRLIVESLLQLAGPRLYLLEQPGIFDGNDGLVGKSRDQFDLLFRKWLDSLMGERNNADQLTRPQKWHTQTRSDLADRRMILVGIFWICKNVRNDRGLFGEPRAADERFPPKCVRAVTLEFEILRAQGVSGCPAQTGAIPPEYLGGIGRTQP